MQPLIVTLALDAATQGRFDELRAAHFPPERNHLAAHVTLFHALPGEHLEQVRADLGEAAERSAYEVRVTRVRALGRGVAYDLRSTESTAQHAELARRWAPWLTPPDARPLSAHVTVQIKVRPVTEPRTEEIGGEKDSAYVGEARAVLRGSPPIDSGASEARGMAPGAAGATWAPGGPPAAARAASPSSRCSRLRAETCCQVAVRSERPRPTKLTAQCRSAVTRLLKAVR